MSLFLIDVSLPIFVFAHNPSSSNFFLFLIAIFLSVMMYYGMLETKSDSMTTSVLGWQILVFLSRGIYFLFVVVHHYFVALFFKRRKWIFVNGLE